MSNYRCRLSTDPLLVFAQDILSPDKYGLAIPVPECLHTIQALDPDEKVGVTISIPANWVAALQPMRSTRLTSKEQMYRRALQYFLTYIEEVADEILEYRIEHKSCYDWLFRWLFLLTCPLRWVDMKHYALRSELRLKIGRKETLTDDEATLFNDHGLYQWYGAYETFIRYHNPKAWGFIESLRIKKGRVSHLPFVSAVEGCPGIVKIDRAGELLYNSRGADKFIDYLGLWTDDQVAIYNRAYRDSVVALMNDFYPPLDDERMTSE